MKNIRQIWVQSRACNEVFYYSKQKHKLKNFDLGKAVGGSVALKGIN